MSKATIKQDNLYCIVTRKACPYFAFCWQCPVGAKMEARK